MGRGAQQGPSSDRRAQLIERRADAVRDTLFLSRWREVFGLGIFGRVTQAIKGELELSYLQ